jgi:hypothetical protein
MAGTLTYRHDRHNLEVTEIAFGYDEGYLRRCERSEAIHIAAKRKMDCFAGPVIGAHSLDPLARNDDFNPDG